MMVDEEVLVRVGEIPLWILKSDHQLPIFTGGEGVVPTLRPFDTVFEHHWSSGLEFSFIDVGAKYGLGTIVVANYIHGRGHHSPITAFEPGAAAGLIGRNLALNHVDKLVTLELAAVSDRNGETVMYSAVAHPEDNHLIWRNTDQHSDTKTVQTVSLDSYAESRGIVPPLVLKVDTQGAEWEVWMGMRRVIESGPLTIMVEFTPWAFEGRSQPTQFLRELAARHYVIDINPKNMAGAFRESQQGFHLVEPKSFESFTRSIAASPFGWTDLLCVSQRLHRSSQLVDALLSS